MKIFVPSKLKILINMSLFSLLFQSTIAAANTCLSSYMLVSKDSSLKQNEEEIINSLVERLMKAAKERNIDITDMIQQESVLLALKKHNANIPNFSKKLKEKIKKNNSTLVIIPKVKKSITIPGPYETVQDLHQLLGEDIFKMNSLSDGTIIFNMIGLTDYVAYQDPSTGRIKINSSFQKRIGEVRDGYASLPDGSATMYESNKGSYTLWILYPGSDVKAPIGIDIPGREMVLQLLPLSNGRIIVIKTKGKFCIYTPGPNGTKGHLSGDIFLEDTSIADAVELVNGDIAFALYSGKIVSLNLSNVLNPRFTGTSLGHTKGVTSLSLLSDGRLASSSYDGSVRVWSPGKDPLAPSQYKSNASIPLVEGGFVFKVRKLPDGRLVANSNNGKIHILEEDSSGNFKVIQSDQKHTDISTNLLVLPTGDFITTEATFQGNASLAYLWSAKLIKKELEVQNGN
jgi:WD40 repeat protein